MLCHRRRELCYVFCHVATLLGILSVHCNIYSGYIKTISSEVRRESVICHLRLLSLLHWKQILRNQQNRRSNVDKCFGWPGKCSFGTTKRSSWNWIFSLHRPKYSSGRPKHLFAHVQIPILLVQSNLFFQRAERWVRVAVRRSCQKDYVVTQTFIRTKSTGLFTIFIHQIQRVIIKNIMNLSIYLIEIIRRNILIYFPFSATFVIFRSTHWAPSTRTNFF